MSVILESQVIEIKKWTANKNNEVGIELEKS